MKRDKQPVIDELMMQSEESRKAQQPEMNFRRTSTMNSTPHC